MVKSPLLTLGLVGVIAYLSVRVLSSKGGPSFGDADGEPVPTPHPPMQGTPVPQGPVDPNNIPLPTPYPVPPVAPPVSPPPSPKGFA